MAGEGEPPQPRIEHLVLVKLGLEQLLDQPVYGGSPATGANFLDAYPDDSPHRTETEDILLAFDEMDAADPDYQQTRELILARLLPAFRPPQEA